MQNRRDLATANFFRRAMDCRIDDLSVSGSGVSRRGWRGVVRRLAGWTTAVPASGVMWTAYLRPVFGGFIRRWPRVLVSLFIPDACRYQGRLS